MKQVNVSPSPELEQDVNAMRELLVRIMTKAKDLPDEDEGMKQQQAMATSLVTWGFLIWMGGEITPDPRVIDAMVRNAHATLGMTYSLCESLNEEMQH